MSIASRNRSPFRRGRGHGLCSGFVVLALALTAGELLSESASPRASSPPGLIFDEDCVATILNRQVQLSDDGSFALLNVPVPVGRFRARIVCSRPDGVERATSAFLSGVPNGNTLLGQFELGESAPIAESLSIASPATVLTVAAPGAQLVTTGALVDGTQVDLTLADTGTSYLSSNPAIATVSEDGFVNAVSSGRVLITATNEGVIATFGLRVELGTDADGDGLPDDFESLNATSPGGLNLARLAGVQVVASSFDTAFPPERAIDGELATSWFTAFGDAANRGTSPFLEIVLPGDFDVAQVRLSGNREFADRFDFFAGVVQAFDAAGTEVFDSAGVALPIPDRDLAVPVARAGVRRVRFTATSDESTRPGLAEIEVLSQPGASGLDPADPADAGLDFDGDGLSNADEFVQGTSLFLTDTDSDGLDDAVELALGSSPLLADSDGDGLADGLEPDASTDTDGDGTPNLLDPDSDGDGLPDGLEVALGLDPLRSDSDFDGIPDGSEDGDGDNLPNGEEVLENTDPTDPDSDGDGFLDGAEALRGCDPLRAQTTTVRGRVADADGEGVPGALVRVVGDPLTATSAADGSFTLAESRACLELAVVADLRSAERRLRGQAGPVEPTIGGVTEVGDVVLVEPPTPLYPGPKSPGRGFSTAAADFDGDGTPDVVMADSRNLFLLEGVGDGTFLAPRAVASVLSAASVLAADVDRDGRPDAVIRGNGSVSLFLGLGNGSFQPERRFVTLFGARDVAAGDLNGGDLDLVTAGGTSNDVAVLFSGRAGGYAGPLRATVGARPASVAAGDLDADGVGDLVSANLTSGDLSLLFGRGGSFRTEQRLDTETSPTAVRLADFDADGSLDVAAAGRAGISGGQLAIFLGSGDGSFLPERRFAAGSSPGALAVADFDADGSLDVVVADVSAQDVALLPGDGDGGFAPALAASAGDTVRSLNAADVDLDGADDVLVTVGDDVLVLLGRPGGGLVAQRLLALGSGPRAVALADLDLDGAVDVVLANTFVNSLSVVPGRGDGTFGPEQRLAGFSVPRALDVADLDADGLADVVATNANGRVSVLLGNGDGTLRPQRLFTVGSDPRAVAAGDFDGDGRRDLVTANFGSDDFSLLRGRGDGTFETERRFAAGAARPQALAVADIDGDGRLDVALAHAFVPQVSLHPGNGDATFGTPQLLDVGPAPSSVHTADLDADGDLDLVAANASSGDLSVLLGRGDGSFDPERRFAVGDSPASVSAVDVDLDGVPDLVAVNRNSNEVALLPGNGDGSFRAPSRFATGRAPQALAVADLDGDGGPDLLATNALSSGLSLLFHRLPPPVPAETGPRLFLTAPAPGTRADEGTVLAVTAQASGERPILQVRFLVDGEVVASDPTPPYGADVRLPVMAELAVLGAEAIDLFGRRGRAEEVVVELLPSPPPSVAITSPSAGFEVIEGTTLAIRVDATDDLGVAAVDFLVDGAAVETDGEAPYELDFVVPFGAGPLTLGARAVDLAGREGFAAEVAGEVLADLPPTVAVTAPAPASRVVEESLLAIRVDATDDLGVVAVDFLVDGSLVATDSAAPYELDLDVPLGLGPLALGATAVDTRDQVGVAPEVVVEVIADPGTRVEGRVVDGAGAAVDGATVTTFDETASTLPDGSFSILDVPTVLGDIVVEATANVGGTVLNGFSAPSTPVPDGITDVGTISLVGEALFSTDFGATGVEGSALDEARGTGLRPSHIYRSARAQGTNVLEISGADLGIAARTDSSVDGFAVLADGSILFTVTPFAVGVPGSALAAAAESPFLESNVYRSLADGSNELFLSGDQLGVAGSTLEFNSDVNGLAVLGDGSLVFTATPGTLGVPGSALRDADGSGLLAANLYRSTGDGSNELFLAGDQLGLVAFTGSDVDGLVVRADGSVLFTVGRRAAGVPGSAVEVAADTGFVAANLYRSTGDGSNGLFLSGSELGLLPGDQFEEREESDVDGLSLP